MTRNDSSANLLFIACRLVQPVPKNSTIKSPTFCIKNVHAARKVHRLCNKFYHTKLTLAANHFTKLGSMPIKKKKNLYFINFHRFSCHNNRFPTSSAGFILSFIARCRAVGALRIRIFMFKPVISLIQFIIH